MSNEQEKDVGQEVVKEDSELKTWFINFVGEKMQPPNGEVTVEMCVEVFAKEFPEFLLLVAQENFLRGYAQCMDDLQNSPAGTQEDEQKVQ